eukprot:CAMPEP_0172566078 /NCGR_PEP_ID=MMETSP1067-20121228/110523_1 /TAXON_ID=265564 ORGANISM="Thalassiosira punctigera, Strain Tpunct2005C2" /NCGR_SAMPLE_ID=MMETSP1067 /ASSEMBLY_ACC=CAM_ASM_000444 /LENGTH=167 /DNA_ID=CAMNT_0013357103 /DNA_START=25 /DNA_END=524 /DNA_ORIENTATION=-
MKIDCKVPAKASKEAIWTVITDIENAADNISAITKVKIEEMPPASNEKFDITGLKWSETRVMFGKEATETMWVTDCVVNEYYKTRAENCGAIYISKMYVTSEDTRENEEKDNEVVRRNEINTRNYVGMSFEGEAGTLCAKVMSALLGWMIVGETKKALVQDLKDIKA